MNENNIKYPFFDIKTINIDKDIVFSFYRVFKCIDGYLYPLEDRINHDAEIRIDVYKSGKYDIKMNTRKVIASSLSFMFDCDYSLLKSLFADNINSFDFSLDWLISFNSRYNSLIDKHNDVKFLNTYLFFSKKFKFTNNYKEMVNDNLNYDVELLCCNDFNNIPTIFIISKTESYESKGIDTIKSILDKRNMLFQREYVEDKKLFKFENEVYRFITVKDGFFTLVKFIKEFEKTYNWHCIRNNI